jgi:hypothetical protein
MALIGILNIFGRASVVGALQQGSLLGCGCALGAASPILCLVLVALRPPFTEEEDN